MKFDLYVDRPLLLSILEPEHVAAVDTPWVMAETSRGELLVRSGEHARSVVDDVGARLGRRVGFVVWPRDGRSSTRYRHLSRFPLRADVEGQDRDGIVEEAEEFTGGITSFPFHRSVRGDATHPAGEEVQCYPTITNDYLSPFGVDAVDECLRLTGATRVALPLYGLAGMGRNPRDFLRSLVLRCRDRGVERVSFWSAKQIWATRNDYAEKFLVEDLPGIAAELAPPPRELTLEERVLRLEEKAGLA